MGLCNNKDNLGLGGQPGRGVDSCRASNRKGTKRPRATSLHRSASQGRRAGKTGGGEGVPGDKLKERKIRRALWGATIIKS